MTKRGNRFGHIMRRAKKIENFDQGTPRKIKVRQLALDWIGAENAHVLDCFAGDGTMYRGVWHAAAAYCGIDMKYFPDERLAYVGDNIRILRAIDLNPWNVFDLDAYGSPWDQGAIIAARRTWTTGEKIVMTLTEGTSMKVRMGSLPNALAAMAGVQTKIRTNGQLSDDLLHRAIYRLADRCHCEVEAIHRMTGRGSSRIFYYAVLMQVR